MSIQINNTTIIIIRVFITFFLLIPSLGFCIDIDTISSRIIVLNEGYDRVSAIKTSEGIVLIDTHKSTTDMSRMRDQIIDYFQDSNFVYIINTHSCMEHINGNPLFPNTKRIAHENFAKLPYPDSSDNRIGFLNKNIPQLKDKLMHSKDTSEIKNLTSQIHYFESMRRDFFQSALPPDISFSDNMQIRIGELTFKMTYFGDGAHGTSSIIIYIPEENVLFTGSSLAMPPIIYKTGGWIPKQDVERWISVLDEISSIPDLKKIIAAHVKYFTTKELKEMQDYYGLISTTIIEDHKLGLLKEETFKKLEYSLINKKFMVFTDEKKDQERHNSNIEILWNYYN